MAAVGELAAFYDARFATLQQCKELVPEEPAEREQLLLELNCELKRVAGQAAACREELGRWRVQLQEAARCLSAVRAWQARQAAQAPPPPQALRRADPPPAPAPATEPVKTKPALEQKAVTSSAAARSKPAAPAVGQVAYLTLGQFDAVPKYMKGRVTYDNINAAVDELNSALAEKYRFLAGRMADLPNPRAKKRHQALRAQETKDTKGTHFVTAEELRESPQLKSEASRRSLLTILRHFGLMREVRGPGSLVRFTVVKQ